MTVFVRLISSDSKASDLRLAIEEGRHTVVDPVRLRTVPTSPFAYWISDEVRSLFEIAEEARESYGIVHRQGTQTADDFRFIRTWFELSPRGSKVWLPATTGGKRALAYKDLTASLNWDRDGLEIRGFLDPATGKLRSRPQNVAYIGRPGLTWPSRGVRFSCQFVPNGCAFIGAGSMAFASVETLEALLPVMNSLPFDGLMGLFAGKVGGVRYHAGLVGATPLPRVSEAAVDSLSNLARRAWSSGRRLDTVSEISHAYLLPAVLQVTSEKLLYERVRMWREHLATSSKELQVIQDDIDQLCFELYEISDEDRRAISEGFGVSAANWEDGADGDADDEVVDADPAGLAAELVSWCVGVGVGRFDVRLATGEREWPVEPDPFDPLPVCSPGMLTGDSGLPLEVPPEGHPVEVSPVLVDDPGHRLDITARVRAVFDVVFDDPDAWWTDVGEALGAKRGEVGSWLSKGFFDHHLKIYSKSRRKAPVLWPLGTASGSYTVWLYAHRVTADSLFRVLNDVVSPKLGVERRGLSELVQEAGPNPSAGERKAIDAQEKLVGELEELVEQLNGVAPLWHPDLNDGVVIVLAPLWRLFAHHKAWSKELRKHWDTLVAGEYDWAQLAMHLWPERVVPKCVDDRSLAIAHGLEEVFWVQDDDNPDKWQPRQTPTVRVDDLIAERTDPATKAALEDAI